MPFQLPDLPYVKDALAPHMSAETLQFHHDKHHLAYVDNANKLIVGTGLEGKPLLGPAMHRDGDQRDKRQRGGNARPRIERRREVADADREYSQKPDGEPLERRRLHEHVAPRGDERTQ